MAGKAIAAARTPNPAKLDISNRRPAEFGGRLEKLKVFKEIIEHPRRLPSLDKRYSDEKGKNEALASFCSFVLARYDEGTAKKQTFSTLVGDHMVEINGSVQDRMLVHLVLPQKPESVTVPSANGPKIIVSTRNLTGHDETFPSFNSSDAIKALAKPHIKARLSELLKGELSVLEGQLKMAEEIARDLHMGAKKLLSI